MAIVILSSNMKIVSYVEPNVNSVRPISFPTT